MPKRRDRIEANQGGVEGIANRARQAQAQMKWLKGVIDIVDEAEKQSRAFHEATEVRVDHADQLARLDNYVKLTEDCADDDFGGRNSWFVGEDPAQRVHLWSKLADIIEVLDWAFVQPEPPAQVVALVEHITPFLGDFGRGKLRIAYCEKALPIARKYKLYDSEAVLLALSAWTRIIQGDYLQAEEKIKEGQSVAGAHNLTQRLPVFARYSAHLTGLKACDVGVFGDWEKAFTLYSEAEELTANLPDNFELLKLKTFLARTRHVHYEDEEAHRILVDVHRELETENYPRRLAFVTRLLGEIAFAQRRYEEALHYLEVALDMTWPGKLTTLGTFELHELIQNLWGLGEVMKQFDKWEVAGDCVAAARDGAEILHMKELNKLKSLLAEINFYVKMDESGSAPSNKTIMARTPELLSMLPSGEVNPTYAEWAFQQVVEREFPPNESGLGRKPSRVQKIMKVFQGRWGDVIALDEFAESFAETNNSRRSASNAISWLNKAFERWNLALEIESVTLGGRLPSQTYYHLRSWPHN